MRHLTLLRLPDRDKWDEARGNHVKQEEHGKGSYGQEDFDAREVKLQGERQGINVKGTRNRNIKNQHWEVHPAHGPRLMPVQENICPFIAAIPLNEIVIEEEVSPGHRNSQHQHAKRVEMLG